MANAKKRRRFEEMNFESYRTKVNSEEIIGNFDDQDLVNIHFAADPLVRKYKERDSFEFHALLFEDEQTGYCKCTPERCQERLKREQGDIVFQCQEYNRAGLQRKFLERHLHCYHKTEEELTSQKRKSKNKITQRKKSQPSIMDFVESARSKKQIDHGDVQELKARNAAVIAGCNLQLDFFITEEMMERDRFLLESVGVDPNQAQKFNRGSTAIKEDLFKIGNSNRQLIKSVAPKLAAKSRLTMQVDHQSVIQLTSESSPNALGTALILSATDEKRYSYLLGFENVPSTRIADTVKLAQQAAQD